MRLYTKIDEQIDKEFEVISMNKYLSKQNFYIKNLVLLFFVFIVLVIIRRTI